MDDNEIQERNRAIRYTLGCMEREKMILLLTGIGVICSDWTNEKLEDELFERVRLGEIEEETL